MKSFTWECIFTPPAADGDIRGHRSVGTPLTVQKLIDSPERRQSVAPSGIVYRQSIAGFTPTQAMSYYTKLLYNCGTLVVSDSRSKRSLIRLCKLAVIWQNWNQLMPAAHCGAFLYQAELQDFDNALNTDFKRKHPTFHKRCFVSNISLYKDCTCENGNAVRSTYFALFLYLYKS
jgi:hypothetical protein